MVYKMLLHLSQTIQYIYNAVHRLVFLFSCYIFFYHLLVDVCIFLCPHVYNLFTYACRHNYLRFFLSLLNLNLL